MSSSFAILYSTYLKRIYSTCLMILKNHHLAEEAVQESFMRAYNNMHELKDPAKFEAWIVSIATNCAIDLYKTNQKCIPIADNEVLDYFINQCTPSTNEPLEQLEKLEVSKEIHLAITKLTPPADQILSLTYYWDLKDKEIAEILQIPAGTVKSSLYRAKRTLSRVLPGINKDYLKLTQGAK